MTLDTRMYITGPVNIPDLNTFCLDLLAEKSENFSTREDVKWENTPSTEWDAETKTFVLSDTERSISTQCGQGLCAWFFLNYKTDGPLTTPEESATHDTSICNLPESKFYDQDAEDCDGIHSYNPACWVKLSFDTGYSYDGENGETCTELHAMLIVQIGNWLDSQGVSWKWMNEYTGDVHESYAGLKEFLGEGDKAKAWFTGSVMPLIKRLGEDS